MLFFAALLYHAWIGMRDIFMDYVKPMGLRLTLQFAVVVALLLYLVWANTLLLLIALFCIRRVSVTVEGE